jgi:hypothetical protein
MSDSDAPWGERFRSWINWLLPRAAPTKRTAMDPADCPHNRVVIARKHGCWVRHSFFQGQRQGSRVEVGDTNGTIRVHCFDCGFERTFTNSREKPAWVMALLPFLDQ